MGQKIASLYAEIGADTSGLDKGLSESKSKLGSFKEGFSGFANVAAKSVGFVTAEVALLKKIMDFGAEGAEIQYTADKFDRLAASIGTTSEALMTDMKDATGGLMSELELTAAATDFLTLGLAKTHDEAVRLTSVAGQLGMNMNQLVLTLTNQTTMRFDALGIAVDGFDEKVAALEATGMSAEEAFNEAFLQQAEEQIEKVGSVADSSAAEFMKMEAAIEDAGTELKTLFVPMLSRAATGFTALLTGGKKTTEALYEHNKAVASSGASYEEYREEMERAADVAGYMINKNGDLVNSAGRVVDANFLVSDSQREVNKQVNIWAAESGRYQAAYDNFTGATEEAGSAARDFEGELEALNEMIATGGIGDEMEDFEKTQADIRGEMEGVNQEIDTLLKQGWWEQSDKVQDLRGDYADLEQQLKDNADEHEEATKRMIFDILTQQAAVDGLTDAELEFLGKLAGPEGWGLVDESMATVLGNANDTFSMLEDGTISADDALNIYIDDWESLTDKEITLTTYYKNIGQAGAGQTNAVSGISGSGVYTHGRRAAGGPVFSGQSYLVGEQGPEVVTMGGNGNVTPNNQLMGGDVSAKISEMSAQLDKLNRTLPTAMRDAVLLMGASSGR